MLFMRRASVQHESPAQPYGPVKASSAMLGLVFRPTCEPMTGLGRAGPAWPIGQVYLWWVTHEKEFLKKTTQKISDIKIASKRNHKIGWSRSYIWSIIKYLPSTLKWIVNWTRSWLVLKLSWYCPRQQRNTKYTYYAIQAECQTQYTRNEAESSLGPLKQSYIRWWSPWKQVVQHITPDRIHHLVVWNTFSRGLRCMSVPLSAADP